MSEWNPDNSYQIKARNGYSIENPEIEGNLITVDCIPQWRDISTAPKDGTCIIAYYPRNDKWEDYVLKIQWFPEDEDGPACWCDGMGSVEEPTHWMPIPDSPQKKHTNCQADSCYFIRYEKSLEGKEILILMNGSLSIKINYCPFCGEKV